MTAPAPPRELRFPAGCGAAPGTRMRTPRRAGPVSLRGFPCSPLPSSPPGRGSRSAAPQSASACPRPGGGCPGTVAVPAEGEAEAPLELPAGQQL